MNFSLTASPIDPATLRLSLLKQSAGAFCSYEAGARHQ